MDIPRILKFFDHEMFRCFFSLVVFPWRPKTIRVNKSLKEDTLNSTPARQDRTTQQLIRGTPRKTVSRFSFVPTMSQKYSVTSGKDGNRRKSVFTSSLNNASLTQASSQAIELERLEQEITLVLQGIDKSFAQSHKIVNEKLIPIVRRYHAESKKVWNGVNFWKTFLETSANVELRGYEETVQTELQEGEQSVLDEEMGYDEDDLRYKEDDDANASLGDSNEQMSPVKVGTSAGTHHDALMESTNHTAQDIQKRYTENIRNQPSSIPTSSTTPHTGRRRGPSHGDNPIMPVVANNNVGFDTTDSILPPIPMSANLSNTNNGTDVNQTTPTLRPTNTDTDSRHYVMHHNGDTNYKVQVSPRKKHPHEAAVNSLTPRKPASKKRKSMIAQKFDSSPFEIETPKLMSDVQFSPVKNKSPLRKSITDQEHPNQQSREPQDGNTTQRFPNTPRYGAGGQLLRTPGQVNRVANRYSQNFDTIDDSEQRKDLTTATMMNLNMDDSADAPNISPPVTLNFATVATHGQQLHRTPAREAAQNIVKDLLNNVSGINDTTQYAVFHDATSSVPEETTTHPGKDVLEDDFDAYLDRPPQKDQAADWSDDD